jgi:hypothetical protein
MTLLAEEIGLTLLQNLDPHLVSAVFDKFFTRKITALLLYCTLLALFLINSLQEK